LEHKGIELNIIAYIIIGLVGIMLLMMFVYGPLNLVVKNTFCYFYQTILKQTSDFCKEEPKGIRTVTIEPFDKEELARYIAAYSILCWEELRPVISNSTICFNVKLKSHPGKIYESDVTRIMETDPGDACSVLQNSKVIDESGKLVDYKGDCGKNDNIEWDVFGNYIEKQSLILIKYDMRINKIVISA